MPAEASPPVKATKTTFEIVEALMELDGAGITEVSDHLDLPKSSVHNYLQTLRVLEYVVKHDGTYHVGTQFLELGAYACTHGEFYRAARPQVETLAQQTGEWASMLVEEHGRGTFLYVAGGEQAIPGQNTMTGARVPPLSWLGKGTPLGAVRTTGRRNHRPARTASQDREHDHRSRYPQDGT